MKCHQADLNQRLKWDSDGSLGDMWLSLCSLRLRGITESACSEAIVSEALRLEYGCAPLHVTVNTDYTPNGVEGDALVTFKDLRAVQKMMETKPVFHKVEVSEVLMCDLSWELNSGRRG